MGDAGEVRTWGRRMGRPLIALLIVGGCAVLLWRRSEDLADAWAQIEAWRLIVSALAAIAGTVAIQRSWQALLIGLAGSASVPPGEAPRMFFVTQLGKYLPGSVWPVLAQMQFGVRWGIGRTVMFAANVLLMGVVTASGIVVGALTLPWASPSGFAGYGWTLALLVPLAVALHPRVIPGMLELLLRRLGREPLGVELRLGTLLRASGWMAVAWVLLGLHLVVVMAGFGAVSVSAVAAAIGAIAFGWAAGIAFLPAPAGAGVRDGVIAIVLTPLIGSAAALTTALASRVLLLLADVFLAALSSFARSLRPTKVSR